MDVLEQEETPKAKASLGSMIASLSGAKKYLTLKVIEQAGGQEVMVLIDPGATHNFIDESFVSKKGLKTKSFEGFRVSNANGKLTLVDQIVKKFGVRLQGYMARENFYIYPLDGHPHMIFRVQWLFELGDIHTNYRNLTMSFEIDGKTHTLQEIKGECPQVTNKRMEVIWPHHEEKKEPNDATMGIREAWHLTLGTREAWHLTLGIREAWLLMLDTRRTWHLTRSKSSIVFHSYLLLPMFLQDYVPGLLQTFTTTILCLMWTGISEFWHTFLCLMWIAPDGKDFKEILEFLHAISSSQNDILKADLNEEECINT